MAEDVIGSMLPLVMGSKEQALESERAAKEYQFQQQQRAKQAPIDDLARQVKMQQLKNELSAAPNIAKLLSGVTKETTPQGPAGPQGQQPTVSPQDMYSRTTQVASNIWTQATDPNNPRNLLENPQGLIDLKEMLKTKIEFAKNQIPTATSNIGKFPEPVAIVSGKYVPMSQAPAGSKEAGTIEYDDKGEPKFVARIPETKAPKETLEERSYESWHKENPTIKDDKTGKLRPTNENDYKERERLLAQKDKQAIKDAENKAAAKEVIAGNLDIGPVSSRNQGIIKELHDIDPYFNIRLQHARLTSDTAELTAVKKQRGLVNTYEKTAQVSLKLMEEASKNVDRTDMPVINKWLLSGEKAIGGNTPVARFEAAMTTFSAEYAKIMSGSMGNAVTSNEARAEIQRIISTALTQEQISGPEGVIDLIKKEMAGRISSFDQQIKDTEDRIGGKKPEVDLSKVDWDSFEKTK